MYYTWVHKYIKQGDSKYPKKAVKKGEEGKGQPSPRLHMMGSLQMVGDGCGGVNGVGKWVVKLWGRGEDAETDTGKDIYLTA